MNKIYSDELTEKFINVLKNHIEGEGQEITDMDTSLNELGINSFKAIQLLIDLEIAFDIEIPDDRLVPEIFVNLKSLFNVVESVSDETNQ